MLLRVEVADHHQDKADGKAGGVTGKEHTGDGKAGDGREDYHNVAGRDDRRGGRGARDHCAGELFLVADLLHIGRGDGADSRDSRGAGAGNSAEDHVRRNADDADTAAQPGEQGRAELDDALGKSALIHDRTGYHKERYCHQRERIDAADEAAAVHIHRQSAIAEQHSEEARAEQGERDGNAEQHQCKKRNAGNY